MKTTEEKDGNHTLSVGTQNIYKRYKSMEVELSYNPKLVDYVGNETHNSELVALVGDISKEEISETNHILKYRFSIKKADELTEYKEILNTVFKPKGQTRAAIDTTVSLTNVAGHITKLNTVKAYVPQKVSMDDMKALIAEATKVHNNAEVGIKPGQYTQESKDKLQSAIRSAQAVTDETLQEDRQKEYASLEEALNEFKESVKVAQFVNYHKDYMVSKEIGRASCRERV